MDVCCINLIAFCENKCAFSYNPSVEKIPMDKLGKRDIRWLWQGCMSQMENAADDFVYSSVIASRADSCCDNSATNTNSEILPVNDKDLAPSVWLLKYKVEIP